MALYIGNQKLGSLYLGSTKIKEAWVGDVKVYGSGDPYNPLNLPPFTIRCKFSSSYTPSIGDSQTLVDAGLNVWDITKNDTIWSNLFDSNTYLLEVLGANTSGVTWMNSMFQNCTSLTTVRLFDTTVCGTMATMFNNCTSLSSVPLFDTSSCMNLLNTFTNCTSLTIIPLFDTSNAVHISQMFDGCVNVQSGALALYQQASSRLPYPPGHYRTFRNCGINTPTGLAELQQIPSSWGGLA